MIKCKHCGQMVDDTALFCPKCGQPIEKLSGTTVPPTSEQPSGQQTSNYGQQVPPYKQQQAPNYGQQVPPYQQQQAPNYGQQVPPYQQQQAPNYGQKQNYSTAPNGMRMRNMDMMEACKLFWTKYATFDGRARRAEYWWSCLMLFVINFLLGWTFIIPLATIIPSIAISVRRLHDIGKSGWYYLLCLVPIVGQILLIIWFCQEGNIGRNEYGEDPKYF